MNHYPNSVEAWVQDSGVLLPGSIHIAVPFQFPHLKKQKNYGYQAERAPRGPT